LTITIKKQWGLKQKEPKDKKKDNDYKEEVTKSELTDYIKFPFTLYKNNKYWYHHYWR
jgi:hypothetical protein